MFVPQCEWFALCDKEATHLVKHPILGEVYACINCLDKAGVSIPLNPNVTELISGGIIVRGGQ